MSVFRQDRPPECLSRLAIDRLLADELAGAARTQAEQHLRGCERCQRLRAEIEADRADFRAAPPLLRLRAQRPAPARSTGPRWWFYLAPAAAAAALAVLLWPREINHLLEPEPPTRIKGGRLSYVIAHRGRQRPGRPRDEVAPGDRLQFFHTLTRPQQLALLGRDGTGKVMVYHPASGSTTVRVPAGRRVPLPRSIELDATPGQERFYGVLCREPTPLAGLRRAVRDRPDDPRLPPGCAVERFVLDKAIE